jgi:hypothetical protein
MLIQFAISSPVQMTDDAFRVRSRVTNQVTTFHFSNNVAAVAFDRFDSGSTEQTNYNFCTRRRLDASVRPNVHLQVQLSDRGRQFSQGSFVQKFALLFTKDDAFESLQLNQISVVILLGIVVRHERHKQSSFQSETSQEQTTCFG